MKTIRRANLLVIVLAISTSCAALSAKQGAGAFDYRQIILDNGMHVITLEDFSCPIVAVQVWYLARNMPEEPA